MSKNIFLISIPQILKSGVWIENLFYTEKLCIEIYVLFYNDNTKKY